MYSAPVSNTSLSPQGQQLLVRGGDQLGGRRGPGEPADEARPRGNVAVLRRRQREGVQGGRREVPQLKVGSW